MIARKGFILYLRERNLSEWCCLIVQWITIFNKAFLNFLIAKIYSYPTLGSKQFDPIWAAKF